MVTSYWKISIFIIQFGYIFSMASKDLRLWMGIQCVHSESNHKRIKNLLCSKLGWKHDSDLCICLINWWNCLFFRRFKNCTKRIFKNNSPSLLSDIMEYYESLGAERNLELNTKFWTWFHFSRREINCDSQAISLVIVLNIWVHV